MGEFLSNFGVGEANSDSKFRAVKKKQRHHHSKEQELHGKKKKKKLTKDKLGENICNLHHIRANVFNIEIIFKS